MELLEKKIITKEEAKKMLLSENTEDETKVLEEKIEFLMGVIDALTKLNKTYTITYPGWYDSRPWFNTWSTTVTGASSTGTVNFVSSTGGTGYQLEQTLS